MAFGTPFLATPIGVALRENTYKNIMRYDGDKFGNNANLYKETLVSPHPPTPTKVIKEG